MDLESHNKNRYKVHSPEGQTVLKRRGCLQQVNEIAHSNARLSKNRRKCSPGQYSVKRHDDSSSALVTELHMATSLTD